MPMLFIDDEQAELLDIASEMMAGALLARSRRADPDRIITDSHKLQANKLAAVRAQLKAKAPPHLSQLHEAFQAKALNLMRTIIAEPKSSNADRAWVSLRGMVNSADLP